MRAAAVISAIALVVVSALPAGAAPAWTVVADAGAPAATELTDIACVSSTRCFAVGYRQNGDEDRALIEMGVGKSWKRMSRPVPAGQRPANFPPLSSIVCPAPGSCFAVGTYLNSSGQQTALIHRWNGKAWGLMNGTSVQPAQRTSLNSVACPSPKSCFAVGYYQDLKGAIKTLVKRWTGAAWNAMAAPTASGRTTVLHDVTCISDTSCFAVGTSAGATSTKPFVIRWNGKTWAGVATPGLATAGLDDVACASAKACFALGSVAGKTTSILLERWNGTKWSVVTLKNMPAANHLFGIACPTTTACIAVGRKAWTTAGFQTLALKWNGTTWTELTPANQPDATSNWLNSVTCSSANRCRAVGTYLVDGTYRSLIEYYS